MLDKKSLGISNALIMVLILVVIILAAGVGAVFYFYQQKLSLNQNNNLNMIVPKEKEIALLAVNKRLIQPEDIEIEKINIQPQIPAYQLPLSEKDIANWEKFSQKIKLSDEAKTLLDKNGFVVTDTPADLIDKPDEFAAYYQALTNKDLPVFITTDSLLHYYHIFFDTTLMKLERDIFYDDVWQLSQELYNQALMQYQTTTGDLQEAAKRNLAYLSVALELLKPKPDQISSDATLRAEYCPEGSDEEYCQMMLAGVKDQYGDKASYKYFSSSEAAKYSFEIPEVVKDQVEKELKLITDHEGWNASPIFIYQEDYSQYVPRGHYTKSERLKNYFKTLMWYGRMTALITGSPILPEGKSECTGPMNGIVSEADAKIQTLQASLIALNFGQSQYLQQLWQRMYAITSYLVGFSDDLGPYEYSQVLNQVLGNNIILADLENKYNEIKSALDKLTYNPKIYSGLGKCQMMMPCPPLSEQELQSLKAQAQKLLAETKGFRMMGQRFTLDSYLFSEIVSPYSGEFNGEKFALPTDELPLTFSWDDQYYPDKQNRPFTWVKTEVAGCPDGREVKGFPAGLDIMAIFGSERAKQISDNLGDSQYSDYQSKFEVLKQEVDNLPQDAWFSNLYMNWLYVLQGLLQKPEAGYQTFMTTEAWQDKELNTALASWAELRHDTILYVKQSYTMAEMGAGEELPIVGYVEPMPEFYNRLLTLTKLTNKGLKKLLTEEQYQNLDIQYSLEEFDRILTELLDISQKELQNKELTDEQYSFIKHFGDSSKRLIETAAGGKTDPDIYKTTLIADVHTEGNVKKALEEGVGYIKTLLAAYKLPDNRILLGVGPVFSYYEFKQPMDNRLTDEAWRQMLESDKYPDQPSWVKSFTK
jgi:hypothetical protein